MTQVLRPPLSTAPCGGHRYCVRHLTPPPVEDTVAGVPHTTINFDQSSISFIKKDLLLRMRGTTERCQHMALAGGNICCRKKCPGRSGTSFR
ncbi:unnamed protein product [Boreogadus saida]